MKRICAKLRPKDKVFLNDIRKKKSVSLFMLKSNVLFLIVVGLLFSITSKGQISVVSSATNTSSTTSLTITKPIDLQVGDLMIANITQRGSESNATSTGWTRQTSYVVSTTNRSATILYKVATSTDVAASNFTFTVTSATSIAGGITAFRGVNTASGGGIEVMGTVATGNSTGPIAPSQITTLTNNAMVVFLGQISGSDVTFSSDWTVGGIKMTQGYAVSHITAEPSAGLAYLTQATAGATGAGSKQFSASARWGGVLLALRHSNTVGAASSTPTLCINTALTNITHTTTGATGIGTATGLPSNVTASWASNTITISGTPTQSGTFNYSIPLTGGNGSVNATGTITVNAAPSIGTQPSDATICVGGTYSPSVVASGGVTLSYQWQYSSSLNGTYSNVSNGTPANASYANATRSGLTVSGNIAAGSYYYKCVVSSTGSGCSTVTSNAATLTVNADPSIGTQPSGATICVGGTYTPSVVASGGIALSYQWQYSSSVSGTYSNVANSTPANATYANATTSTLTVSGNIAAGSYYYKCVVSSTGSGCSTATSNAGTLTVNALPTAVTVTGGGSICSGSSTTLAASNGSSGTIYWQNTTSGGTSTATASTSQSVNSTGTYYFRAQSSQGCWGNQGSATVTVNQASVAPTSISGTTTICNGSSTTLTAAGGTLGTGANYQWGTGSTVGSNIISGQTNSSITVSPTSATTYWVRITNGTSPCSVSTSGVTVSVTLVSSNTITLSSATGTNTQTKCTNTAITNITYVTTGATGATFSGLPSGVSGSWSSNVATISGTPSVSGTFNYTVTMTGGCTGGTNTASGTITVISLPSTTATNGGPYCVGSTIQLTGGPSADIINYSWTGPNGYTNATSSQAGISENFDGTVSGWSFSGASVTTGLSCSGTKSVVFSANGNLVITPSIINPGILNCSIKAANQAGSWTLDVQISDESPVSQTSGPWTTVSAISGATLACTSISSLDLSAYKGIRYIRFVDTRPGAAAPLRSIDNVVITSLSHPESPSISNATLAMSGDYTLTATNTYGCSASATTMVSVIALPSALVLTGSTVCNGSTTSITSSSSASGVNYQLYNNSNTAVGSAVPGTGSGLTWSNMAAGSGYYVIGTHATTTCASTSNTVAVTVNPSPTISLSYIDDVSPLATSFTIPYTAVSENPDQYSITTASNSANSIAMSGFTPVTNASLTSSPLTVAIPQSSAAEYGFYFTVTNSTTGCSTTYPFQFHVTSLSHGVVGSDQTICYGSVPATLNNITAGSGAGTISYSWEQSTTSIDAGYTAIPGANGASYSPGALTQTTYFKRVATNGLETSDSDPITVTVAFNWIGTTSNWNTASNWCAGIVPSSNSYVIIPVTANNPVISAAATCGAITIQAGAELTINNGYTLSVYGDFNNNGTVSNNGSIKLAGTAAQAFPGSGTIGSMSTLEINNAAGVTLSNNISIKTELKPTAGTLNLSNHDITLKSSVNSTASVSALGATAAFNYNGTGRFIVERYINTGAHNKAWHLLAAPTQGGQTIHASWMEGAVTNGNPNPGYGIIIGGPTGTAGGFDLYTPQAVMKTYATASNSWVGVANPKTTAIGTANGYMVFIRSDRRPDQTLVPTILRTRGTLQVGTISPVSVSAGLFQTVGNPYPSAIIADSIIKKSGIAKSFYVFDPSFSSTRSLGGYQTINAITGYLAVPGGTALYNTVDSYHKIESGQAFMLRGSTGATLTFKEAFKTSGSRITTRVSSATNTANTIAMLRTNLIAVSGTTTELSDGNAAVFDNAYSNAVDEDDALKPINAGENFALIRDGNKLSVEAKSALSASDTLYYDMSNLRQPMTYRIQFIPQNLTSTNMVAELIDNYNNTRTSVVLSDSSSISIVTNSNIASTARNRFMLVFRSLVSLPVTITSVSATRNADKKIMVRWTVDNEINMNHYIVEKSADGNHFGPIGSDIQPIIHQGGSASYNLTDSTATIAAQYYRIKAVSIGGQIQYSSIVNVSPVALTRSIEVFPNPITDRVANIYFNQQPAGDYKIFIYNNLGQVVYQNRISIQFSNQSIQLPISKDLPVGKYQMTIISSVGNSKKTLSILIK